MPSEETKAFTLVEVLVVMAVISILMAILIPALSTARSQVRGVICRSNLRQLLIAGIGYSIDNDGFYVPAAKDFWNGSGGYHRWHGVRDHPDKPFDPLRGPLVAYLADGQVKECPERVRFMKGQSWSQNFEQGCGGYGYNMTYLGSRLWEAGLSFRQRYSKTTNSLEVAKPDRTLMFADCAMSITDGCHIEYSFAEPPYFVMSGRPFTDMYASPSIHFRHKKRANVGWADGHIDVREIAGFGDTNIYNVISINMNLGWFEPIDNRLFDLK